MTLPLIPPWKPRSQAVQHAVRQVVFTIHNLDFGQSYIGEAAYYCQRFTTVSPTYAMEVRASSGLRA